MTLPSHSEGFPNVILEALSFELPVVATTVGGVPDILSEGVGGILVPPRDIASLSKALLTLSLDPSLRDSLGGKGRALVLDRYSIRNRLDSLEDLYMGLL